MKKTFTLAEVLMLKQTIGIENEVLYSRMSEGQAPSNLRRRFSAFTLAEVLITLAIIGVVAALTIPTVAAKFQQRELYARFMVAYNIFNNAFYQLNNNGMLGNTNEEYFASADALQENLKSSVRCDFNDSKCYANGNIVIKDLKGNAYRTWSDSLIIYTLQNGIDFQITNMYSVGGYWMRVYIDTNGINKGPNIMGRDCFEFDFYPYQNVLGFDPSVYSNFVDARENNGKLIIDSRQITDGCNVETGSAYACGAKLLLERKMDY